MASSTITSAFTAAHLPEPWMVAVLLAAAVLAAWAGWRWYGPRAPGAAGTIARLCRSLALALLVLLLGGPAWRRTTTTVLPGSLLVLVDTSASMARADGPGDRSRIEIARDLAQRLAGEATTRRCRVEVRAMQADAPRTDLATLTATAPDSPLGDALLAAAGSRADVVVAATDGRVTDGTTLAAAGARLRGRDQRLMLLALGGERLDPELLIDEVIVNRECALDEQEPVAVRVSFRALPAGPIRAALLVGGAEVDRHELVPEAGDPQNLQSAELRLAAVFRAEGPARVTVRVEAAGIIRQHELGVTVRERRLTVLLLDQRPRYELRYLREALKRDRGAAVHAYLSDGRWRRWGAEGPEQLPLTAALLTPYDAIVLGDLGPDAFREADLAALAAHVRTRGAGLVLLPGETGAQAGLGRSPLAELLPATYPDADALARGYLAQQPRRLRRTALAESQGLLDSGGAPWQSLPPLLGAAPLTVRPGSEILAEDTDGQPLVVARAAGSGRVVTVAVDDTWRWRAGAGDTWLHRFHSQVLRFAAAGRRAGASPWRVVVNPRRAAPGETVSLALVCGPEIDVPDSASLRLTGPDGAEAVVPLVRQGGGFAARIPAPAAGSWSVLVAAGPPASQVEEGELVVVLPERERRDPRTDRAALDACAAACGGQVFTDPAALLAALPADLGRGESSDEDHGLWDNAWALLAVCALLAVDWAIRRRHRLP